MAARKSDIFLWYVSVAILVLVLLATHAFLERRKAFSHFAHQIRMVEKLQLTDLCLFTDARYTRHPSMADMYTAFQDNPFSFEHFPSGTLVPPPPHLTNHGVD